LKIIIYDHPVGLFYILKVPVLERLGTKKEMWHSASGSANRIRSETNCLGIQPYILTPVTEITH